MTERKLNVHAVGTVADLHRMIKDVEFAAGVPYVASNGLANVVAFPPLADGKQVLIKGRGGDFTVYVGDSIEEREHTGLFHMTGIVSATDDLTRVKGGAAATPSTLVNDVVERIEALGL